MPSKSYKGNFVGAEGGSLGMRWVKMAGSPLLSRDLKEGVVWFDGRFNFWVRCDELGIACNSNFPFPFSKN
jgi:hypothetical protein